MEINMTNGQMGICSFERKRSSYVNCCRNPSSLHVFLISRKPIYGICINTKNANNTWGFSSRVVCNRTIVALSKEESKNELVDGRFIEKELTFQPTFNEYLKALESVRSVRETKQSEEANGCPSNNNSRRKSTPRTHLLEEGEENAKLGGSKGHSCRVKADSREQDEKSTFRTVLEGSARDKLGYRGGENKVRGKSKWEPNQGFLKKGGVGGARGSDQDELDKRKRNIDLKVERDLGEYRSTGSFEKTNGKYVKGQVNNAEQKTLKPKFQNSKGHKSVEERHRESAAVKNLGSNLELDGGEIGQNGSSMWNLSDFEMNNTLIDEEYLNSTDEEKRMNEMNMEDSNVNGTVEKMRSYGEQGHEKLKYKSFDMEKNGYTSTKMYKRTDRFHIQEEKSTEANAIQKEPKIPRGDKALKENAYQNDLEMERAAFKSFEVFTDIRGRPRVSRMEMEERIKKLAKWLNGTDINLPEWLFSKMMHSAKIKFTEHTILRVIQILGVLGNWKRVLQVIEWLHLRERFKSCKSRYIYTAALDALGKAKRPVEALNVFHAMQQQQSSYPDRAAYHCIAVTLGQAGHMKELFDVIDCMRSPPQKRFKMGMFVKWDPRLEPDIVVYNAVLNACVRRKQWEGAFWVLQQLKQSGLQPSSTTYGLVMEVMFACGKYNLVHDFFRKVQKSSIPNALNYKVLVNTFWREGKTDEALLVVQDMERRGIVGTASLYYDLARCLCCAGRCQEALLLIDKICKVANKPLVLTYTGLIQACLDSGRVQDGAYIFNQMHDFCSPNLVTYNIMLKAYLEHRMFEEGKVLFQKILEDGKHIISKRDLRNRSIPDMYTFNTMLDACVTEKRWDDFEYVYHQMLYHGYHFNAKRHLRMVLDACRAGKGELLELTWKHLVRADRIPPPSIVKERFCMKLGEDDCAAAIFCISKHPSSELQAFSVKAWLDLLKSNAHRFKEDTLVRLIHEVRVFIARSNDPSPIFQNLLTSCRYFFQNDIRNVGINPAENVTIIIQEVEQNSC